MPPSPPPPRQTGPAKRDGKGQRSQGQGQQRKIDPAPAQDQETHQQRQHGREQQGKRKGQQDLPLEPVQLSQGCGIAANTKPGALAKRNQAGVTHQQVQAHGSQGQDHHHGGRIKGQANGKKSQGQNHQADGAHPQRAVVWVSKKAHARAVFIQSVRCAHPASLVAAASAPKTSGCTWRPRLPQAGSG